MNIFYDRIIYIKLLGNKMQENTMLDKLNEKVSEIVQKYHSMQGENEMLRNELVTLKAQRELKDKEIERLSEENAMKDLEIEEIVNKIESILG
jgi:cell division protein ZapB